jgi:EF-P beta-lysylation protein EpmB
MGRCALYFFPNSMKTPRENRRTIITRSQNDRRYPDKGICRNLDDLIAFLGLDRNHAPYELGESGDFPLAVPWSYIGRMQKGEWNDPLLLQVVPRACEAVRRIGFTGDPVGDAQAEIVPGLLYKYASRALLLASGRCAMHCRFCFRRRRAVSASAQTDQCRDYLSRHGEISEIILSGGDPLCCDTGDLSGLFEWAGAVPHIRTLRIHTRVPVVAPELCDKRTIALIRGLAKSKTCIVVVHVNHPAELADDAVLCLTRLAATGALLLNQSVLLKGVNDSAAVLEALSRALIAYNVLPYYLHQLDRVDGAWQFEVEEERGRALMQDLRCRLPGYAVPRYVREVAGEKAKRPLG